MELQILVSKKGTRVVTATNLHRALRLPDYKFNSDVHKWLNDVYAFGEEVRRPYKMKDYAQRDFQYSKLKDYYISLELAKHITLNSNSVVKQYYAKYIMMMTYNEEDKAESKKQHLSENNAAINNTAGNSDVFPSSVQLDLW